MPASKLRTRLGRRVQTAQVSRRLLQAGLQSHRQELPPLPAGGQSAPAHTRLTTAGQAALAPGSAARGQARVACQHSQKLLRMHASMMAHDGCLTF